jgi:hypothetical protein
MEREVILACVVTLLRLLLHWVRAMPDRPFMSYHSWSQTRLIGQLPNAIRTYPQAGSPSHIPIPIARLHTEALPVKSFSGW